MTVTQVVEIIPSFMELTTESNEASPHSLARFTYDLFYEKRLQYRMLRL